MEQSQIQSAMLQKYPYVCEYASFFLKAFFKPARTVWHLVFIVPFVIIGINDKIDLQLVLISLKETA